MFFQFFLKRINDCILCVHFQKWLEFGAVQYTNVRQRTNVSGLKQVRGEVHGLPQGQHLPI